MWCWNCTMWGWNRQILEKKNKGTTKCEKRTDTCNVGIAQCKDEPSNVRKK